MGALQNGKANQEVNEPTWKWHFSSLDTMLSRIVSIHSEDWDRDQHFRRRRVKREQVEKREYLWVFRCVLASPKEALYVGPKVTRKFQDTIFEVFSCLLSKEDASIGHLLAYLCRSAGRCGNAMKKEGPTISDHPSINWPTQVRLIFLWR